MVDRKIKTYLTDDMQNAPFALADCQPFLPVEYVSSPDEADMIVGRRKSAFDTDAIPRDRHYLLWTHEPFFDWTPTWRVRNFLPHRLNGADLYVFNVHNGAVYTDNFYLAPRTGRMRLLTGPQDLNVAHADRTLTFAATFKLAKLIVHGANASLNATRCQLALDLHQRERIRVIGRGWPADVSGEDSRFVNRVRSKTDFLKSSNFNLCYENCVADYYVTEKLWESIYSGCLPVYYSNDTVYQSFPKNSFVDGRDFGTADELLAFIDAMSCDELIERINLCRTVYNDVVLEARRVPSRARSLRRLTTFLETLT